MGYDSHQESDAEKNAGFFHQGCPGAQGGGEQYREAPCCDSTGREVRGGHAFWFWELAVSLRAGSGNINAPEVFAWGHKVPSCLFLSPAAKEGKK